MKAQVEFRSSSFPPREGEEEQINPGRWGMALAEYLAEGVSRHGFEADVGGYEDWGVYINVENDDFPLMIGCGNSEDGEDGFLVFVDPSKPEIKKGFFRRRVIHARPIIERLVDALDKTLKEHEDIREIEWYESA